MIHGHPVHQVEIGSLLVALQQGEWTVHANDGEEGFVVLACRHADADGKCRHGETGIGEAEEYAVRELVDGGVLAEHQLAGVFAQRDRRVRMTIVGCTTLIGVGCEVREDTEKARRERIELRRQGDRWKEAVDSEADQRVWPLLDGVVAGHDQAEITRLVGAERGR